MQCKQCNASFNLYSLYQDFYENIPLAKKIVDVTRKAVWGSGFTIDAKEYSTKMDEFEEKNNMTELVRSIISDTIIFGQCLVEVARDNPPRLMRLDPATIEIRKGFRQPRGSFGYYDSIEALLQRIPGSRTREISSDNLISFVGQDFMGEPIGTSIYGLWLHYWFVLRFSSDALINTHFMEGKGSTKEIDSIRRFSEEQVIMGSGVPAFLLGEDRASRLPSLGEKILLDVFTQSADERKSSIEDVMEENVFSVVLGEEFDSQESWPDFVWIP